MQEVVKSFGAVISSCSTLLIPRYRGGGGRVYGRIMLKGILSK
jgi:hypothetical protein